MENIFKVFSHGKINFETISVMYFSGIKFENSKINCFLKFPTIYTVSHMDSTWRTKVWEYVITTFTPQIKWNHRAIYLIFLSPYMYITVLIVINAT